MSDRLCDCCIKKLCESFGEDMGMTDAGEFMFLFEQTFPHEWINELSKDKIDNSRIHYLIALYCNHNFEDYYKYSIEWLLKTDQNGINEENFEAFLVLKSGVDFRNNSVEFADESGNLFLGMFSTKQIGE